ncbi:MAG TPA: response regulator [Candidatus Limnocylindria bacterium]|nr:response regulator [Candidatus Limnocylindria bacterium]
MFEEWRILHIDEDDIERREFCRALEQNQFAGTCDTVRSIAEGKSWLEESVYAPHLRARPDIVVLNWHAERDNDVMDLVRWMRTQPPFRETPIAAWVGPETPSSIRERARSAGMTELIHKPQTFEGLVEQAEELLQRCVSRCVAR